MLLVRCINAEDKQRKLKKDDIYIVTRNVLGLNMWYLLSGLEKEAAYPTSWFEIVDRNYVEVEKIEIKEHEQLKLF